MKTEKQPPVHLDYFDRPLSVDDCVVFSVRNCFQVGRISRITETMIRVVGYDYARKNWATGETQGDLKYSHECMLVDPQEVTMYLLRKQKL